MRISGSAAFCFCKSCSIPLLIDTSGALALVIPTAQIIPALAAIG